MYFLKVTLNIDGQWGDTYDVVSPLSLSLFLVCSSTPMNSPVSRKFLFKFRHDELLLCILRSASSTEVAFHGQYRCGNMNNKTVDMRYVQNMQQAI